MAIPVTPPPRALRDLRRLARELDASLTDVATLTLMVGITVIRQNWAKRGANEVAA